MILEQKKGSRKKIFRLDETGILVTSKGKGKFPNEEHIPFENIQSARFSYTTINYQYLIGTAICLMILVMALSSADSSNISKPFNIMLWGGGSVLCTLFFFMHRTTAYFLKTYTGKSLRFFNTKDKLSIENFIKTAISRRNEYLKFKYATPIPYLDYQTQHHNLGVLLREKIITQQEYEQKITKLNDFFQQQKSGTNLIGYSEN